MTMPTRFSRNALASILGLACSLAGAGGAGVLPFAENELLHDVVREYPSITFHTMPPAQVHQLCTWMGEQAATTFHSLADGWSAKDIDAATNREVVAGTLKAGDARLRQSVLTYAQRMLPAKRPDGFNLLKAENDLLAHTTLVCRLELER